MSSCRFIRRIGDQRLLNMLHCIVILCKTAIVNNFISYGTVANDFNFDLDVVFTAGGPTLVLIL